MIWRVFINKREERPVEVLGVNRETRTVLVRRMPNTQKALIDAICDYWLQNEIEWSITEVLRYEKPAHLFFAVKWIEGDDE
jgi:hypothetical protein